MTLLIKVSFICIFAMAVLSENSEQGRSSPVSDDDIAMIFKNRRYVESILKCVQNEGPCDPQGKTIKRLAPFIVRGHCPQCKDDQVRQMRRYIAFIQKNYPKEWAKIVKQHAG